ncbi:hypothetical protein HKD37_17G047901 [Glycine soja]
MRWISCFKSSYETTGTLDLKVSRSVAPFSSNRFRYSVWAFWLRISARTLSWTLSVFRVISSMNCKVFAFLSSQLAVAMLIEETRGPGMMHCGRHVGPDMLPRQQKFP